MLVATEKENWSKEILFSETKSLSAQRNWVFAVCDLWSLSSNLDLVWDTFSLRYMPILHFPLPTYSFMFSGSCPPHILRYMPPTYFWVSHSFLEMKGRLCWKFKAWVNVETEMRCQPHQKGNSHSHSCTILHNIKKSKSCITIKKFKCTALLLNQSWDEMRWNTS